MKGKTLAAASLAFVMALGLSACGQDDPADEAGQQADEANQNSQYMDGEGANATSEGAADQAGGDTMDSDSGDTMSNDTDVTEDSGTMQGMNESQESTDESTGMREGGTGHTATNAGSSGTMSQAEEAEQINNSSSNTQ